MYQYLFKKKKKHYPVVVKYIFCFTWGFLMQSVMAILQSREIQWENKLAYEVSDCNDKINKMAKKIVTNRKNKELFKQLVTYDSYQITDRSYVCIRNDCVSSVLGKGGMRQFDYGEQFVLPKKVDLVDAIWVDCNDTEKICHMGLKVQEKDQTTVYYFAGYNYGTKEHKDYLVLFDFEAKEALDAYNKKTINRIRNQYIHNTETLKKSHKDQLTNAIETLKTSHKDQLTNEIEKLKFSQKKELDAVRTELDTKLKTEEKKLESEKEISTDLAKKLQDAEKSIRQLTYLLIVLVVIFGFSIFYSFSKKYIPAENVTEGQNAFAAEDPPVQRKEAENNSPENIDPEQNSTDSTDEEPRPTENDEDTLNESRSQNYSTDCNSILVRDSYHEEHCSDSRATITQEDKTPPPESEHSIARTLTEEERTEESSSTQN